MVDLDMGLDNEVVAGAAPAVAEAPRPADPGPEVRGRWTLYTGELPIGAWGGVCAITGKPPKPGERFIDIGFTVLNDTPNGDVCLHEEYVREIAIGLGMATGEALALANEVIAEQAEEINELKGELDYMRQVAPEAIALHDIAEGLGRLEVLVAEDIEARKPRPRKPTSKTTKETK